MLKKQVRINIIRKLQLKETDTGSAEVQVGLLTKKIEELIGHLKTSPKDHHSRRGLLRMVGQRKRFMDYLRKNKKETCGQIFKELNLK
ncbi:MAG: 30S ribosomal protein S15 [bacterium]|nr:30S ribosomal protein S15 [bacterium]